MAFDEYGAEIDENGNEVKKDVEGGGAEEDKDDDIQSG